MDPNLIRKPAIWLALILPLVILCSGLYWYWMNGIIWQDILVLVSFYQLSFFGLGVGAHRFLSHRSFKAPVFIESILFILASSALQYSPMYWAALHRKHHRFSDRVGDPHSPWMADHPFKNRMEGWMHSYILWAVTFDFEKTMKEYVPDLLKKPHLCFLHRHHYIIGMSFIPLAGLIEWAMIGNAEGFLRGLFWGGLCRIFLLHNSIFLLNSFVGHGFGTRIFNLNDNSRNNVLIFPMLLGDCWHNNHHASPASASLQARWYQLDPHYYFLKILEKSKIISSVKPFNHELLDITGHTD